MKRFLTYVSGPCTNVVCQNGGSCVNGICVCRFGFTGDRCQIGVPRGLDWGWDLQEVGQPSRLTSTVMFSGFRSVENILPLGETLPGGGVRNFPAISAIFFPQFSAIFGGLPQFLPMGSQFSEGVQNLRMWFEFHNFCFVHPF